MRDSTAKELYNTFRDFTATWYAKETGKDKKNSQEYIDDLVHGNKVYYDMRGTVIEEPIDALRILYKELAEKAAKVNCNGNIYTGMKEILKNAKKGTRQVLEMMSPEMSDGFKYVTDSYIMLATKCDVDLPQCKPEERYPNCVDMCNKDRYTMHDTVIPTIADMELFMKTHKKKDKWDTVYSLMKIEDDNTDGGCYWVDAKKMLLVAKALGDNAHWSKNTSPLSAIVATSDDGMSKGLVLPVRDNESDYQ